MLKKLLLKLIQPLIRDAVASEISRIIECEPPKLQAIKIGYIKSGNKLTVWEALENDPIEISLCVSWIDTNGLEEFKIYKSKDLAEFKHVMNTLTPRHKLFNSVSLHVQPQGSTKSIIQNLHGGGDRHYNSADLPIAFKPVIEWIDKRPELLV
jgi:hypothetical protein